MISLTIYYLFFLIKKTYPDSFTTPPHGKKIKLYSQICRDKYEIIFFHNKFIYLLDKSEHNDNLDTNAIVKKFLVTANEVSDDIQIIFLENIQRFSIQLSCLH
jgi:hypothetical protein